MKTRSIFYITTTILVITLLTACFNERSSITPVQEAEPETVERFETPTPEPSPEPELEPEPELDEHERTVSNHMEDTSYVQETNGTKGILVAIDPGHQRRGNSSQELLGPGTSETKAKVAGGTSGVATGVPEYELTLDISFLLRDELMSRGYEVFMIRESHDVDISNRTRAEMATEAGAHIFVRVHANGNTNSAVNGILTISPTKKTPYIPALYSRSLALSQCILDEMLATTGAKNMGIWETDTMTGINWSTMPVTIIELGFMTNPEEDRLMQTADYQQKLVDGIANGIDFFFIFEFGD